MRTRLFKLLRKQFENKFWGGFTPIQQKLMMILAIDCKSTAPMDVIDAFNRHGLDIHQIKPAMDNLMERGIIQEVWVIRHEGELVEVWDDRPTYPKTIEEEARIRDIRQSVFITSPTPPVIQLEWWLSKAAQKGLKDSLVVTSDERG